MSEEIPTTPDFETIKQFSPYGAEYWSARDLAPLLGYQRWENFEVAIKRGITACQQVGQNDSDHFRGATKMVSVGSKAQREVKDYILSRFAAYLIAQNGDPRKPEIAAAQTYFAIATRENEIAQLKAAQEERLQLRERLSDSNKDLASAAHSAGVLPANFGQFQNAGYEGLYGGLDVAGIRAKKGIASKDDVLDRMGSSELAANDFRITQTRDKLRNERILGQSKAIETHREVGKTVRKAIEEIGGVMPEELPAEPSIKPLLDEKKRRQKKSLPANSDKAAQGNLFDEPTNGE